jgi:hypothetical protein
MIKVRLTSTAEKLIHEIRQINRDHSHHIILYFGGSFSWRVSDRFSERGHTCNSRYGNARRCSDHSGWYQAGQKTISAVSQFLGIRAA